MSKIVNKENGLLNRYLGSAGSACDIINNPPHLSPFAIPSSVHLHPLPLDLPEDLFPQCGQDVFRVPDPPSRH